MSRFECITSKLFFLRRLSTLLLFQLVSAGAFSIPFSNALAVNVDCRELDVSVEVTKDINEGINNTIKIDLKDLKSSSVIISLVGPKKLFRKDIQDTEIKNLSKGTYSVVIVGRDESMGYCPKHIQVIID